ncbi:hypothetical protein LNQ52_19670 [Klebsiella pneumoniae subsp. pneumoniae]|nr:hypothetical protein [Klebsiella pneumoniae subsp. pneumoniae]
MMPEQQNHRYASKRDVLRSIRTIKQRCAGQQNGAIAKNEMSCQFLLHLVILR